MRTKDWGNVIISRIKCGIGRHDWGYGIVTTRGGFGIGKCCRLCGTWHPKESIRAPCPTEQMDGEQL